MIIGRIVNFTIDSETFTGKVIDKFLAEGTHKYVVLLVTGDIKIILCGRLKKILDLETSDIDFHDLQSK